MNKMKSGIAIVLMFFAIRGLAQENHDKRGFVVASAGIKGGLNLSNLYTDDAEKEKMLMGFNIGLFAKLPIARYLAIQPELYFTTKGAEITYNNPFVSGVGRFRYNYIEMPILLVINLNENFNIHGGPYAAYMVSGDVTNKSGNSLFNFEDNINTDDYNKFDVGVAAGAGIDIGAVGLGARYSYGIGKVGKERTYLGTTTYTFPNAHNSVVSLYITISLN
ncbi:MAG: porin family protein [Bacteroidota bacterium]